ncbi:MAG: hypothetical protein AAGA80_11005 [Cyanobacteria bacterium P01_F01_bin.143]
MQFKFKTTAILLMSLAFNGIAWASQAKIESQSPAPIITNTQHHAQLSQTSPEFEILIRAIRQFLTRERYEIESKLKIFGNFPGGSFSFSAQLQTTIEAPNRFRSEIAFTNPDGDVGNQYTVTSNGTEVWIHNLNENKYSVMDYQSFRDYDDSFLIGFFSSIFFEMQEDKETVDVFLNLTEDQLIETLETELQTEITSANYGTENVEGIQYNTYSYKDVEEDLTITAFVKPTTATIGHLDVSGQDEDLNLSIRESIVEVNTLRFIPASTFRFVPPFDAEKSDTSLPIEPF